MAALSVIISSAYFVAKRSLSFKNFLANVPHLFLRHSNPSILTITFLLVNNLIKGKNKHPDTPKTNSTSL